MTGLYILMRQALTVRYADIVNNYIKTNKII